MSKYQAISEMQSIIMKYVDSKIPKNINKAQTGIVVGKKVHLTSGKTFRFEPVIDAYFASGSKVACLVPDSGNFAAIVGVF